MRIDRESKKHYRKCDNSTETDLKPDHIFNYLAIIPNLLKIDVFFTTVENNIELISKAIIHVHGDT